MYFCPLPAQPRQMQPLMSLPHVLAAWAQVRWEATKGFHLPDLLCKECGSLEEMMEVRWGEDGLGRGEQRRRRHFPNS